MKHAIWLLAEVPMVMLITLNSAADAGVITGINVRNSVNPSSYSIEEAALVDGALAYGDRSYPWVNVPTFLTGADYIKTGNNDKDTVGFEMDVSLNAPATVYLFHDDRVPRPGWFTDELRDNDFVSTGTQITLYAEGGTPFSVFQREVATPGPVTITLEQNNAPTRAAAMYGVAAVPLPEPQTYAILVGSRAPGRQNDGTIVPDGIRGDLDVANIALSLSSWVDFENKHRVVVNWDDPDTIQANIQEAFDTIALDIQEGDTLLFYYGGHGGGGSGPGVDETIDAVNGGSYTDDTLASLLKDDALDGVRKVVLLDSCHSGGFWNYRYSNEGDADLETVDLLAFFAAAGEDFTAVNDSRLGDGTGRWTNDLLSHLSADATFDDIRLGIMGDVARDPEITGLFRDFGSGTVPYNPAIYFSPDLDPTGRLDGAVIPEPSTLTGLVGMGIVGLIGWWRRRRR